jgi:gas vesicle protein
MIMKEEIGKINTGARSIWFPLVVGGVVGAGVALLLAPKSGRELRKDITGLASKTRDRVAATVEEGKKFVATTIDEGKNLYEESRVAVKGAIEGGKHAFMEEREKHLKAA